MIGTPSQDWSLDSESPMPETAPRSICLLEGPKRSGRRVLDDLDVSPGPSSNRLAVNALAVVDRRES